MTKNNVRIVGLLFAFVLLVFPQTALADVAVLPGEWERSWGNGNTVNEPGNDNTTQVSAVPDSEPLIDPDVDEDPMDIESIEDPVVEEPVVIVEEEPVVQSVDVQNENEMNINTSNVE